MLEIFNLFNRVLCSQLFIKSFMFLSLFGLVVSSFFWRSFFFVFFWMEGRRFCFISLCNCSCQMLDVYRLCFVMVSMDIIIVILMLIFNVYVRFEIVIIKFFIFIVVFGFFWLGENGYVFKLRCFQQKVDVFFNQIIIEVVYNNDYLIEESVCFLLRVFWFEGMFVFVQLEEFEDYYEDEEFDDYYFKFNVCIGN